ncbi:hypothetical protein MASR1M36_03960 [Candidatus Cloacimonadaceae bacterium]
MIKHKVLSPRSISLLVIVSLVIAILLSSFGCAVNTGDLAGRINGEPIKKDEFYSSYRGHYAIFSYKNGHSPDQKEKDKLIKETWLNITRTVVLRDYYRKYKLSASSQEVLDTLSKNIPDHIVQSSLFRVNGKFNSNLYQLSLTTDKPENLTALRRQYQEFYIPTQKLKAKLLENELITQADKKMMARVIAGKANLELAVFDQDKAKIQVSDGEIAAYYKENLAQYLQEPLIKLNYCRLPVLTDDLDRQSAKLVADSVFAQIRRGRSMEELVAGDKNKQLSFIEHGFVKTAELPADLAIILNGLSEGEASEPQAETNGWMLYQKIQSTKTLTYYRSMFVQSIPRSVSLAAPEAIAKRLQNLALSIGLSEAANEFDLELFALPAQNPDSLVIFKSDLARHLSKLRESSSGTIWEPLYSAEKNAWFVFEIVSNLPRKVKTLEEVFPEIKAQLARNNSKKQNLNRAYAWQTDPAANPPDQIIILENVGLDTSHQDFPISRLYVKALQNHLHKKAAPFIAHKQLIIIPLVKAYTPGTAKVSQAQIISAYNLGLDDNWFDTWLDEKVNQAKVIKYNNQ